MRIANHDDRLTLVVDGRGIDIETASGGRFSADVHAAYRRWDELLEWYAEQVDPGAGFELDPALLGPPSPLPAQVFAVGLNYPDHVAEGGYTRPEVPTIFTKFPTSITGPYGQVTLPGGNVDWEVELVAVIGRKIPVPIEPEHAWRFVAGLTAGQDISERITQHRPPTPQFSLGKSFAGFGPLGPVLVTPDEFADPDDLELTCSLNGAVVQSARTSSAIFGVPEIISYLSGVVTMLPGDVIFTGTPHGVGRARRPPLFLKPGDVLESTVEHIGTMRHVFVAEADHLIQAGRG